MDGRYERDTSSHDRALSFFDAVYGFSLTLLVVTIEVKGVGAWRSPEALLDAVGSQVLSFLISFAVIAVFWRKNHTAIGRFTALDNVTITLNIVAIGFVVLIPFTTRAIGDPRLSNLPLPTSVYALNVALAILASVVMQEVARHRGLVDVDQPPEVRRAHLLNVLSTPAVFLLSIPVAYLGAALWDDASVGRLFWLILLVTGPVAGRWARRVAARSLAESAD